MVAPRQPEVAKLLTTIQEQAALIVSLREQLASAEERVAELEGRLGGGSGRKPPHFVKANRAPKPEGESRERKKRSENHARKLEARTEEVIHSLEACPDCGRALPPGWVHRRRQVLDIPVASYIVREHVVMRHRCGVCGKTYTAQPDLSDEVVGQHRVGIRAMALVAYLKTEHRLPLEAIRRLLRALYGLSLSVGELTRLLHETAARGRGRYEALREELRAASVLHADETVLRENGINGYLWVFLTPTLRWFLRSQSRAHTVPLGVLGPQFGGVLVTDFYSGYTPLNCPKQRCWVHFLRDLKALEEEHADKPEVVRWRAQIRALYAQATEYRAQQLAYQGPRTMQLIRARAKVRREFEGALLKLARSHLRSPTDPCRTLAERIIRFRWELFVFLENPEVPPENNLAERGLRPAVIARKVSGGSRSPLGSETMAILRTLFGTWPLRGLEPLDACRRLLASSSA